MKPIVALLMGFVASVARGQGFAIGSDDDHQYALTIQNLRTEGSWVVCGEGEKPIVTVTKGPGEDQYRVVVECPCKPAVTVPTS